MAKKQSGSPTPLQLAHAKRKSESARVAKLSPTDRTAQIGTQYVARAIAAIRKVAVLATAKYVTKNTKGENIYTPKFVLTDVQKREILATLQREVNALDGKLTPGEAGTKKKRGVEFSFSK